MLTKFLLVKNELLHLEDLQFEYLEWAHDVDINFILIYWNPKPKTYSNFQKF
jgi:hypothetical protein